MLNKKCTHAATSNSRLAGLKIKKKSRHAATTSLTVLAVCNGTFNAAAFVGNPFLFLGGREHSHGKTQHTHGKQVLVRS